MANAVPLDDLPADARKALPFNHAALDDYAAKVEEANGLPSGTIRAIKNFGERSHPGAVSPKGARGVMQFMPETGARYGLEDPHDPLQAIEAAGKYLKDISGKIGSNNPALLAAAYNAGENRASLRAGKVPDIPETQAYAVRVNNAMRNVYGPKPGAVVPADDLPGDMPAAVPAAASAPAPRPKAPIVDNLNAATLDPTGSFGSNALAGAGKALTDMVRGVKQIGAKAGNAVGLVSDKTAAGVQADIDEAARLDKPLMGTGGGVVGNVAGNVAGMLLPGAVLKTGGQALAMVPGAAKAAQALLTAGKALNAPTTFKGAAAGGAALGALGPVTTEEGEGGRLLNAGLGAAGSLAGQAVGSWLAKRGMNKAADAAAAQSRNSVRDATLQAAQDAGYVVPPSTVSNSWLARRLESIAGKAAIGQDASIKNQDVTNLLARRALGMADDAPLTESALDAVKKAKGRAYGDVAALSPDASDALYALREARAAATGHFKHYNVSADPAALERARKAASDAQFYEQFLESEARSAGRPDLLPALREARAALAKAFDVERALNTSTGQVDARQLGRMIDKGRPLTGELETIARFADAFPQYAREGARVPTPNVSKSEALAMALLGGGGFAAGGPVGLAAGLLPLASGPVREALLSRAAQKAMAKPSYNPGKLASPIAQRLLERASAPGAAAALVVPELQ